MRTEIDDWAMRVIDRRLDPPEEARDPLVSGMLETLDRLEKELSALRDEQEDFNSFAHTARFLEVGLKAAIEAGYENNIYHRENEQTAIRKHLSELGYTA